MAPVLLFISAPDSISISFIFSLSFLCTSDHGKHIHIICSDKLWGCRQIGKFQSNRNSSFVVPPATQPISNPLDFSDRRSISFWALHCFYSCTHLSEPELLHLFTIVSRHTDCFTRQTNVAEQSLCLDIFFPKKILGDFVHIQSFRGTFELT